MKRKPSTHPLEHHPAFRAVIAAAAAEARKLNTGGVIAVVDDGGNLMALERLDGTFAAGANVSIGKARTAALFKKPTRVFEEAIGKGRTSIRSRPYARLVEVTVRSMNGRSATISFGTTWSRWTSAG